MPTVAPELAYGDLAVSDGNMASEAFREILHPETTPERRSELRRDLLAYCGRNTGAMVKIAQRFQEDGITSGQMLS